jgi:hypothetical protein
VAVVVVLVVVAAAAMLVAVEAIAVAATRERVTCRNMKTPVVLFLTFVLLFLQAKCTK